MRGRRSASGARHAASLQTTAWTCSISGFDLSRENNVHIAFGVGPHRCLGSHLARIELQVIYEQMLARLPEFRLDPDKGASFHAGNIIAIDSLPLLWG